METRGSQDDPSPDISAYVAHHSSKAIAEDDLDDILLMKVGKSLGNDLYKVAVKLGFTTAEIENTKSSDPHNAEQWGFQILRSWKQRQPKSVSRRRVLVTALRESKRNDLVEMVGPKDLGADVVSNITRNVAAFMDTEDLHRCLDHMAKHDRVILTGMSGIGKTEIAKKYWHTNKTQYDVGWLIPSKSNSELITSILQFLEKLAQVDVAIELPKDKLNLANVLGKIHLEIERSSTKMSVKYLLIFDDVREETHHAIYQGFPPEPDHIAVIITTQQSLPSNKAALPLYGLTQEEAMHLMQDIKDKDELKVELWKTMSALPSALVCAVHDILKIQRGIKYYIVEIKDKNQYESIEKRDLKALGISYGKTPIEAHVRNAKEILEDLEIEKKGESVCFVLKTIGFFNSKDIPEFILRDILRQRHIDDKKTVIEDEEIDREMDRLVVKMQDRSYITISPNENHGYGDDGRFMDTHVLTQLGIRYAMGENDQQPVLEILMRVLLRYFAKDTRYMKFFSRNTRLMPHVETVLEHFEKLGATDVSFDMKVMAIALNDILGYSYTQNGFIDVAEKKLEKSVKMMYNVLNINEKDLDSLTKGGLDDEDDAEKFAHEKAEFIYDKLKRLGNSLVDKLVLNTVLNTVDVDLMKSKDKELPNLLSQNRTNKNIYNELVKKNLAISEEKMQLAYLPELFASVLYSHGRMYFYRSPRPKSKTNTYISNLRLASALCEIIENKIHCIVFHRILSQRNGLMYLYSERTDEFGEEKNKEERLKDLYDGKIGYEDLCKQTDKQDCFQHGILKVTKNDPFHKCKCLEKVLFICTEILKLETVTEKREKVIKEGRTVVNELMEVLGDQEKDLKLHKASNFYAETAKFLQEAKCWNDAYEYYKEAIDRCKKPSTRHIVWKRYRKCCLGLTSVARNIDAKEAVTEAEKVIKEFKGVSPEHEVDALNEKLDAL